MSDEDPLREDHHLLQREVREKRKAFAASAEGSFARAMRGAMDEYHKMRQQGVSREDACKGLEQVIRDAWPKPTTKFPSICDECDGTGYRRTTCWSERRCGRAWCANAHPAHEHGYVVVCECPAGDKFRQAQYRQENPESAVVAVGRVAKKAKSWQRLGR